MSQTILVTGASSGIGAAIADAVVAAGGHWSGGSPPGDWIIAYALPETAP